MKRIITICILGVFAGQMIFGQNELNGTWTLVMSNKGKDLHLKHKLDNDDSYNMSVSINDLNLSGFRTGENVTFYLKNSTGEIRYTGKVEEESGSGTFKYSASPEYVKAIGKIGLAGVKTRELMFFTIKNADVSFFKAFADMGYSDQLSDKATALVALEISPAFVSEIKSLGYDDVPLGKVISFKALGVTPEYIAGLKSQYGEELSLNDITSHKAMNIDPGYAAEMKRAGFNLAPQKLVAFKAMGISAAYLKELESAGLDDFDADDALMLKAHNIDSEFIMQCRKEGLEDMTPQAIVKYKIFEITPEYSKMIKQAGYSDITFQELIEFKIHKIDAEFIKKATQFNDGTLPEPRKLIRLKISRNLPSDQT
jgi:hypothetical protein